MWKQAECELYMIVCPATVGKLRMVLGVKRLAYPVAWVPIFRCSFGRCWCSMTRRQMRSQAMLMMKRWSIKRSFKYSRAQEADDAVLQTARCPQCRAKGVSDRRLAQPQRLICVTTTTIAGKIAYVTFNV